MNGDPIYKIIVLDVSKDNSMQFSHETVAWFHKFESAKNVIDHNSYDIQDAAFNYAVIMKSFEGCYDIDCEELAWFKWDETKREWVKALRPSALDGFQLM